MSTDDRVAREREALLALASVDDSELDSSDHELIWMAATGRLSSTETARWLDRAAQSSAVAESWQLAVSLHRQAGAAEAPPRPTAERAVPRWTVLAAAALVLVVLVPSLWQRRPRAPYRGAEVAPLVSLLEEAQALPRDRFLLRWAPAAGEGWTYSLTVTSRDLEPLVSEPELDTTEYLVPAWVLNEIAEDDLVYWRVHAKNARGEERWSQTFITRVR